MDPIQASFDETNLYAANLSSGGDIDRRGRRLFRGARVVSGEVAFLWSAITRTFVDTVHHHGVHVRGAHVITSWVQTPRHESAVGVGGRATDRHELLLPPLIAQAVDH